MHGVELVDCHGMSLWRVMDLSLIYDANTRCQRLSCHCWPVLILTSQAKLKADKYKRKIEAELARLEQEKLAQRKAEITLHRL